MPKIRCQNCELLFHHQGDAVGTYITCPGCKVHIKIKARQGHGGGHGRGHRRRKHSGGKGSRRIWGYLRGFLIGLILALAALAIFAAF